jgi:hypothetical protein
MSNKKGALFLGPNTKFSPESDQHVNIYSFAVCCDRMWPSTQWHMVYTGSGNVPYVQFESVGDFIPEPKCSKFAVGLQTEGSKMGGARGPVGLWTEGPRVMGAPTCAKYSSMCSVFVRLILFIGRARIPFYRWRGWPYKRERESTYATKSCCPYRRVQDDGKRPQYCFVPYARGRFYRIHHVW